MTIQTSQMVISPCNLTYKGVDLGGTLDNVVIDAKYDMSEVKADQTGTTMRDKRISGFMAKVTTSIAEPRDLSRVAVVFPHATLLTGGGATALEFRLPIAQDAISLAGLLSLRPLQETTGAKDHTFYKALANNESQFVYSPTEQTKLKMVFDVYPDESVSPTRWYRYGDTSAT